jgi:hypothetical protein
MDTTNARLGSGFDQDRLERGEIINFGILVIEIDRRE